jgi:phosphatidylserine/phosphatidylglycerophosphate/cardiolipin synthase-like enzyme
VEALSDEELASMPAADMADLAAAALRPNIFQSMRGAQKERLSNGLFRVLDSAAAQSPGKLDAVLSRMRLTEYVVPHRFKVGRLGATDRFQDLVERNRIERGNMEAFDQRLQDAGHTQDVGSMKVLVDGKAAFGDLHQTMMKALASARPPEQGGTGKPGFVLLSTFALQSDKTGEDVAADLKALSAAGFKVHVLYDGFGSKMSGGKWSDAEFYTKLKEAGVDLHMIKSTAPLFMHNSHKKPIQIGYYGDDGPKLIEYNGDMNIGDEYREFWHGSMTRIEGPATKGTLNALVDQLKANGAQLSSTEEATFQHFANSQVAKPGMSPIWTVNHKGPDDLNNKMVLLNIINVAPKGGHLFIEQPYVDDPDLFPALERAAQEGVHVHLIVPKNNNQKGVALATREEYKSLMAAGVQVHEFQGPQFKNPNGFSHLKRIVVLDEHGEGLISQDGSTNSDAQSFYHNDELIHLLTTARIKDPVLRRQKSDLIKGVAHDVFVTDIKNSHRVTAADSPAPGLTDDLVRLLGRWRVTGWLE